VEEFASVRYAIAGAERLREPIAKGYREKYGIDLLEGYGCTELAPVVSVNVPDVIDNGEKQPGHKPGTVGRPIPGVAAKIIDPDTAKPLPTDQEAAPRQGTQRHGRLSRPAGIDCASDARRLVCDRRYRRY
jgi:acyl-[acyl-carrier-protein]-phospholipid O-acyltransferase/long-chain-fatty-acid--[acyl-carrier-protein] ligase